RPRRDPPPPSTGAGRRGAAAGPASTGRPRRLVPRGEAGRLGAEREPAPGAERLARLCLQAASRAEIHGWGPTLDDGGIPPSGTLFPDGGIITNVRAVLRYAVITRPTRWACRSRGSRRRPGTARCPT